MNKQMAKPGSKCDPFLQRRTPINGEEGVLRYRGYAIEDLAEKANFLEVAYLLIFVLQVFH